MYVTTEVLRNDADRQVVTAAVDGPASYLARGCGQVLHVRRANVAFLVDNRVEDTTTWYADMAFGSQNSQVGPHVPTAPTIIASRATALSARLAKEMVCAAAALHKHYSGGNKGWTSTSTALQAKGAPAPSAQ